MVRVLIVDDSQAKIALVTETLDKIEVNVEYETVMNAHEAKRKLRESRYDVMLLDIFLPKRPSEAPQVDGGLEVLRWLRRQDHTLRPSYIIGLTTFEESYRVAQTEFSNFLWSIIVVQLSENGWKNKLKDTIVLVHDQLKPPFRGDGRSFRKDVLVVTALSTPELDAVLSLPANFKQIDVHNDASIYYEGAIPCSNGLISIIAVSASDKGMTGTAIAAMKGIHAFWPKFVFMTGITAGLKGRTEIGDVIFADLTWDWGSGKIKEVSGEDVFVPAPYQRRLDETYSRAAHRLSKDSEFLRKLWTSFEGTRGKHPPKILVGAMASGASVLQSSNAVQKVIEQHKDVFAIEMEAFSLMFTCQAAPNPRPIPIVAKSVCDNGDSFKDDNFQLYAASISAQVFYEFCVRYLSADVGGSD